MGPSVKKSFAHRRLLGNHSANTPLNWEKWITEESPNEEQVGGQTQESERTRGLELHSSMYH